MEQPSIFVYRKLWTRKSTGSKIAVKSAVIFFGVGKAATTELS